MPRYMLGTDTCSYIMKRSSPTVVKRLRAVPVMDVCISVITKSELLYWTLPIRRVRSKVDE
jgi:predicted nucleic acid-binding protein